jgi:hypothetical protein
MTLKSGPGGDLIAATESRLGAIATGCPRAGPNDCTLLLVPPRDGLTRLLMKADGVTEADFDTLMRTIAKVIAHRHRVQTWAEASAAALEARTT